MRESKHDDSLLYIMQDNKYLKSYNALSGELSETIYTTTQAKEKPKAIDSTDKYVFIIE